MARRGGSFRGKETENKGEEGGREGRGREGRREGGREGGREKGVKYVHVYMYLQCTVWRETLARFLIWRFGEF